MCACFRVCDAFGSDNGIVLMTQSSCEGAHYVKLIWIQKKKKSYPWVDIFALVNRDVTFRRFVSSEGHRFYCYRCSL